MPAARARTIADDLPPAAPLVDTYTGLLIISLVATVIGLVFLFLDYNEYPAGKAPSVKAITVPSRTELPVQAAPQGQPVQPVPAPAPAMPPGAAQPKAGGPQEK